MTLAVAVFAAQSVACSLTFTNLLEVQDGSELEVTILTLPPQTTPLEGGNSMDIEIENRNAPDQPLSKERQCCNRKIIEHAIP